MHFSDNPILPARNVELENALISSILMENSVFWSVQEILGGQARAAVAFHSESSRWTWKAIAALMTQGAEVSLGRQSVDLVMIGDWLNSQRGRGDKTLFEELGGSGFLHRLSGCFGLPNLACDYARRLKRYADLRDMIASFQNLALKASEASADPDEIIRSATQQIGQVALSKVSSNTSTADEVDQRWEQDFSDMLAGRQERYYQSGIRQLDQMLKGGIYTGRYYVIAGLTKHGKTTLALSIACAMAFNHAAAVDWISVEMTDIEMQDKFLSHLCGFNVEDFKLECFERNLASMATITAACQHDPKLDQKWRALAEARATFASSGIKITVNGSPDVRDIEAMVRARRSTLEPTRPYFIFVDYIQKLSTDRRLQGVDKLEDITSRLNTLSKDKALNCGVFSIAQFNRSGEKGFADDSKPPSYADVKGSSTVAQDANHLWILHRAYHAHAEPKFQAYTEIRQDLSRHGNMGHKCTLAVNLPTSRFTDWPRDWTTPGSGGF